jgi:hypothetical protein
MVRKGVPVGGHAPILTRGVTLSWVGAPEGTMNLEDEAGYPIPLVSAWVVLATLLMSQFDLRALDGWG